MCRRHALKGANLTTMKHRFRVSYDESYDSSLYATATVDDGLTHQSFRDECDINTILRAWSADGIATVNASQPAYLDLSNVDDYKASIDRLNAANDAFDALPSKLRYHFKNDPALLLDYIHNPATTKADLAALGLIDNFDNTTLSTDSSKPEQLPT